MEILLPRNEPKDWNGKRDPRHEGNALMSCQLPVISYEFAVINGQQLVKSGKLKVKLPVTDSQLAVASRC